MSLKLNSSGGGSVTVQEPTTASNRTLNLPDADGTVVYADGSGNVGIGTSSPVAKLQINQATTGTYFRANASTADRQLTLTTTTTTNNGDTHTLNVDSGTGVFAISIDNTQRARFDANGILSLRNFTSTAPWDQNTAGQNGYVWLGQSTYPLGIANQNQICGIFNRYQGSGTVIEIKNGTTVVGSISHNGSNTAYNTSSDYRLKENVQPMTGALAKIAALKPCTYTWKSDGSAGEGFIAHELAEVCSGAVHGEKDATNEDGSIKPQGIDTSFLVATLTAAIQEQQQMIETLQAKVAALEAK